MCVVPLQSKINLKTMSQIIFVILNSLSVIGRIIIDNTCSGSHLTPEYRANGIWVNIQQQQRGYKTRVLAPNLMKFWKI